MNNATAALTVNVPAADDAEITILSLPTCPCGLAPVSRFVTALAGVTGLVCDDCFDRVLRTQELVTHHTRSSHQLCDHDSTPADRAKCRAARRKGEIYVGDGYGDDTDEDDVTLVGSTKGSKLVHAVSEAGATACGKTPKTLVSTAGTSDDVNCSDCLDAV